MPGIDWELRLVNEVSAAAKQMSLDMRNLGQTLKDAKAGLESVAGAEHKEAGAAREAKAEHEGFFGDMLKAELWADLIKEGAERFADLTEELVRGAAEAVDFDYKTGVALTHLTGSAGEAKEIMERARAFANGVGEDFDKAAGAFQRLAQTGLRGENLSAAATAARDLAKVSGVDFGQTIELFRQVGSERGFGPRGAAILAQYPGLLKQMKSDMGLANASFETFSKHIKNLHGQDALNTLNAEIAKFAHEDQLGDVSVELGDSFEGAANKIKNDWKEALGSIAEDPTLDLIRGDISAIADYFDPANAGGQELAETLKGIADPAHELFAFLKDNRGAIADALSAGIEAAKFTIEAVVKTIEALTMSVEGLQAAFQYLGALAETKSFSKAKEVVTEYYEEQKLRQSRDDEAERERRMSPKERKEEADLQRSTQEAIHSGVRLPELAPLPSKADGGTVDRTGLVTVHEGEEVVPAAFSRGGSSTSVANGGHEFHFHVSVPGGGEGQQMDEQLLATRLAELAPAAIMSALEQMNQMRGGR